MTAYNAAVLLLVIVLTGLLGGFANYVVLRKNDPANAVWSKSVLMGILAAFIVPLFLKTISSDIVASISEIKWGSGVPFELFIFASFCLLAAYFSKAFLDNMGEKLDELEKKAALAADKADRADAKATKVVAESDRRLAELEPAMAILSEREQPSAIQPLTAGFASMMPATVDDEGTKVLKALAIDKYAYRTASGISADTHSDQAEVLNCLQKLKDLDLVGQRTGNARDLWFLTDNGREVVRSQGWAKAAAA